KPVLFVSLLLSAFVAWGLTVAHGILLPILFISLIGALHLSLRSIILAFAMDVTPPEIGASTIGFVFSANQFFSALMPIMTGYLADIYGLRIAFLMFAVLTLLAALWVPLMSASREDTSLPHAQQA
uniref:MFS transporter n=1 Tax=Candidatus Entotheonella palauensis TaxID=93172 RepID=UPI0011786CA4